MNVPIDEILVAGGHGETALRTPSEPVRAADDSLRRDIARVAAALAAFRRARGFGRALAAPQIGIRRRFVVMDLGAGPVALVNPEIAWRSDDTFEVWDDCLSVPDRVVRVRRHCSVTVSFRDEQFRPRVWRALPADMAELVQHELDHLDGVLMLDRAVGPDAVRPIADRDALVGGQRPRPRIAVERIAAAVARIDPVFLGSPQLEVATLSAALGCSVTVKVETFNPVRSFKGRGADLFAAALADAGDTRPLACGSAGNFGQALAYACGKRGLRLTVFAATSANPLKLERMRALGADVRLEGVDFDAAKDAARRYAGATGARMVEDGREPVITEGAGTAAVELFAAGAAFDAVLVPLGNGALLNGVARWSKAVSPATRTIGVVSAGAPAMQAAWRAGSGALAKTLPQVDTIADGIGVRAPIPEAVDDMTGVVDDVVAVDDADVVRAMRLVHEHVGLVVEPAGAVGIAALLAQPDRHRGQRVATVLTGGNVTPAQMRTWLWPE